MKTVEIREYPSGMRTLVAYVQDDGHVAFAAKAAGAPDSEIGIRAPVSATVLRQLADLVDAVKA